MPGYQSKNRGYTSIQRILLNYAHGTSQGRFPVSSRGRRHDTFNAVRAAGTSVQSGHNSVVLKYRSQLYKCRPLSLHSRYTEQSTFNFTEYGETVRHVGPSCRTVVMSAHVGPYLFGDSCVRRHCSSELPGPTGGTLRHVGHSRRLTRHAPDMSGRRLSGRHRSGRVVLARDGPLMLTGMFTRHCRPRCVHQQQEKLSVKFTG